MSTVLLLIVLVGAVAAVAACLCLTYQYAQAQPPEIEQQHSKSTPMPGPPPPLPPPPPPPPSTDLQGYPVTSSRRADPMGLLADATPTFTDSSSRSTYRLELWEGAMAGHMSDGAKACDDCSPLCGAGSSSMLARISGPMTASERQGYDGYGIVLVTERVPASKAPASAASWGKITSNRGGTVTGTLVHDTEDGARCASLIFLCPWDAPHASCPAQKDKTSALVRFDVTASFEAGDAVDLAIPVRYKRTA